MSAEKRIYARALLMRSTKRNISSTSVEFEKHQPERRRGFGGYLFCGGGCCCCCCCLHTLGGLAGAAVASARTRSSTGASVSGFYWKCVAIQTAICVLASGISLEFGLILALVFLPLLQLVASVATSIWILRGGPESPDRIAKLQTLRTITLWFIIGAVSGLILMIYGFKAFQ